jgi:LPXTG-motif cell wall-anchored protein
LFSARTRLAALAAATGLTLAGAVLSAGSAQAADGTTISVHSEDGAVFSDEPFEADGTCTSGATTAVVSLEQGDDVVAQDSVDVEEDGSWSATLDISEAGDGAAVASVDCFGYDSQAPVGSASEEVFVLTFDVDVFDVTVAPSKVRIGSSFTMTGHCPAGTEVAAAAAGNADADEPFVSATVTPAADGTTTARLTVPRKGVSTGDALAVIACGVDAETAFGSPQAAAVPTAFGIGEFTILAAPAAAPAAAGDDPELANTGSDSLPMTALGLGLVLLGTGAYGARRVAGRVTR